MRLTVIGKAAVLKRDARHIVIGFCYRQLSRHIGNSVVICAITRKCCGHGIFARIRLVVACVCYGNACGESSGNDKAVRLAVISNANALERDIRHIVSSF